ncbi:MAG: HDIG domain-containing protein [Desulfobacteraceae bacterium]|nr:HDIG domain-containing protein [Desulfobacteraceae bacterium]
MKINRKTTPLNTMLISNMQIRWVLLAFLLILFTLIIYPSIAVKEFTYDMGDVADRDVKAVEDFFVEDEAATRSNREQAAGAVLTVYDYDPVLFLKINERVSRSFSELQGFFETTPENPAPSSMPPAEENVPGTTPDESIALPDQSTGTTRVDLAEAAREDAKTIARTDLIWSKKEYFEQELGIPVSHGAYTILVKEQFSTGISDLIKKIVTEIMKNGVVANKEILLKEAEKGISLRDVGTKTEAEIRNLRRFYSPDQAKTMVRVVGDPLLKNGSYEVVNLIVEFSQSLIQPNISLNRNGTEERKKISAEDIKPVLYKIKAGEMILREGERVTEFQLLKLKAMQNQSKRSKVFPTLFGVLTILTCLFLSIYSLQLKSHRSFNLNHNKNLLFLVTALSAFLIIIQFTAILAESRGVASSFSIPAASLEYGIPISAGVMLVCLFLGLEVATAFAIVLAASAAILLQNRFEIFTYFLLNGVMAGYWIKDCRDRKAIIQAGAKIGALNVVLAIAIDFYLSQYSGLSILWDSIFAFLAGIGAGIVTIGVAPIIEIAFQYTTDITLLELANLDRPILRRLMIEAPGTYHHSVIVGSLVEAAASDIGANPLLAKVCGYYHDIGKINKPLYFIENQTNGKNKHDKLAPSMSSLILIAHVRDGVEISKKNKLGKAITDTIEQHHGTSLISFFYEKAKQQRGQDQVKIEDFRYPGPKPQTKEAGLVMLADVVEAASRTLDNPTPSRIQGLVQNLVNKIFSDGQLDSCELTLKDLHNIARSFNKILNGIHHHRIEYADSPARGNGKGKDAGADKQPPDTTRDADRNREDESRGRLKRLGLS